MNTNTKLPKIERQSASSSLTNPQAMRWVRMASWAVTLVFLAALAWAIYQAVAKGNRLPLWAWVGAIALGAAVIGLAVSVMIYRGIHKGEGVFNMRPTSHLAGELRHESKRVEAASAKALQTEIKMLEGVLQLGTGAKAALEGSFTYDDADWKPPMVDYAVDAAGQGSLVLEQQSTHRPAMRQGRCEWDLRLSQELPMGLKVKFGAGKAELKLGGLRLNQLQVESGVGELHLDLSGEWTSSLEATIKTGIGDTRLRLPRDAGVRIQPITNFGSVHADGLIWDGTAYTNAAYRRAAETLEIRMEGGIGKISLEQAEA
jgi:hypothetical protein